MTFWRHVICYVWNKAQGLSVVLEPFGRGLRDAWQCLHTTPAPPNFEHHDCLYTRLVMGGLKANANGS